MQSRWINTLLLILCVFCASPSLAQPVCSDLFANPSGVNPNLGANGISPFDLANVPWQNTSWPTSGSTLTGGSYYFGSLVVNNDYQLNIAAGARATIYVNGVVDVNNFLELNANGTANQLTLVVSSSVVVNNHADINGLIFAAGAISINANNVLVGGLAANGAISVGANTTVTRNQQAIDELVLPGLCSASLSCRTDNFNSTLSDNWVATRSSGSFTPQIVSNRLRMTQAAGGQATSATYQRLYPAANNKVVVEFDYWAYGGSGADGIAIILSDAAVTPQAGAFGGSLGYAQKGAGTDCPNCPGFAGGWLGIALDEFGNFSNPTEGRVDGPGTRRQSVAIRGAAAGNYRYLRGTAAGLSPGIDNVSSSGNGHRYRITVDSTVAGQAMVSVERDVKAGAGFQTLIAPFNALTYSGQAPVPENFFLSFTGSTGGSHNNHELDNLSVCALRSLPVGEQIDHFEFDYSGQALTCKPEVFTVRACKNAACSELVTQPVTATLSPASGGNVNWLSGNPITFSGGSTTVSLRRTVAGSTTVGVSSSVPSTRPLSQTLCRAGSGSRSSAACTVNFADSGLVFDVADGIANQPQDNIIVSAVKTGAAQQCVPSFANVTRNVAFWSSYITPDSNNRPVSWPVTVNAQQVGLAEAAGVNIPLSFNGQGQASISVNYADAGQIQLNARYTGSAASNDAGLVMNGADQFIRRPLGFCVQTGGECSDADAGCNRFRRAGESFPLTISARAWQSGSTLLCSNPVTPNFAQNGISLTHSLVAPSSGTVGTVSATSYNHNRQLQAQTDVTQSVSEVGVFRFGTAAFNYLTMTDPVPAANSVATGRFYPKDFLLSDASLTAACSSFSYMRQPFGAGFKLTARNMQNVRTRNYAGAFATGNVLLQAENNNNGVELTSRLSGTATPTWSQGELAYQTTALQFSRVTDGSADGPYSQLVLAVNAFDNDGVRVANADVNVATTGDCSGAGNCNARQLAQTGIRYGRMVLQNTSGPEEEPLPLVFRAEYWDGSRFVQNLADSCSLITAAPTLLSTISGSPMLMLQGSDSVLQNGILAADKVWLAPPNSAGSWEIEYQGLPLWLRYHWRGTPAGYQQQPRADIQFGRYRGNPRQIFWREKFQ